ncbi:MAG: class I SAM-dependent methyltransferase [Gemmatimonadota bacterium]|jgi:ubiquinone/menaquinone biosynthesis C-methylase UbiE
MLEQDGNVADLYDRWSGSYDEAANKTRDLAGRALRRLAQMFSDRDVLELGCGTGLNTKWIAARARRVVGVDFSEGMLRQAETQVDAANASFLRHDLGAALPFEAGSWDVVVFALVLEHLASVDGPIAEAARVLRPGGALVICEYHPCRQLAGGQARFRPDAAEDEVRIPAYVHLVSDYVGAALAAGLRLSRMEEASHPDDGPESPPRVVLMWFRK